MFCLSGTDGYGVPPFGPPPGAGQGPGGLKPPPRPLPRALQPNAWTRRKAELARVSINCRRLDISHSQRQPVDGIARRGGRSPESAKADEESSRSKSRAALVVVSVGKPGRVLRGVARGRRRGAAHNPPPALAGGGPNWSGAKNPAPEGQKRHRPNDKTHQLAGQSKSLPGRQALPMPEQQR